MASLEGLYGTRMVALASASRNLGTTAIALGVVLVVVGWDGGVWLAVGGFVGALAANVAVGVASYRRAMAAPWPDVRPVADEDDEW